MGVDFNVETAPWNTINIGTQFRQSIIVECLGLPQDIDTKKTE
jgi:hypothetical protein